MLLQNGISEIFKTCPLLATYATPWKITSQAVSVIIRMQELLGDDYIIENQVARHRECVIEAGVILKPPVIISRGCFIGAHAYLRGGVFLGEKVSIGPGCEVKSSFVFSGSALAHFNFVGDSLVGSGVNMEAGAIVANHFNERTDKRIFVKINGQIIETGVTKFGALIGDGTRIGANAVTTPGTLLPPGSIVGRLELVNQLA
jgi:NDP-sugar pyrophosphorylase family protein